MKAIAEGYSTKVSEETIQAVYSELRFDREKEYLDFLALEEAAEANNLK
jgi:hypothetical protein